MSVKFVAESKVQSQSGQRLNDLIHRTLEVTNVKSGNHFSYHLDPICILFHFDWHIWNESIMIFFRICVLPLLRSIPLHWMAWFRCSCNHTFNHCSSQDSQKNSCCQEKKRENIGPLLSRSRQNRNFHCLVSVYGNIGWENSRIQKTATFVKTRWARRIGDRHFQSRIYPEKTEMWNGN